MGIFDNLGNIFSGEAPQKKWTASDQSKDEKDLCSYVKNFVEEVRSSGNRIASEGIWMTNIAYLLGYDSVYYDTGLRAYRPVNDGARFLSRNRIRVNKILPTAQNRLARLCKNPPRFDILPESSSQDDKDEARQNLEILKQLWNQEHIKLDKQRIPLAQWFQQCGHSYIKLSWDDCLGKPLINPETGEIDGYEGDIRADICSAFEVFPDPLATTMEECTKLVHAKVRKLDYFRSHYGERGEAVQEEGAWLLSVQYEQRINSMNKATTGGGTNAQMKNSAIELSYYEKPSKKHPRGRHVITAAGVLLKDSDLPIGEIPFSKFDDILVAGKYYSEAILTHLRPIQDQVNRLYTIRSNWTNKLLRGKYLAAKGHGIANESINDSDDEVVQYDPVPGAEAPSQMQIPVIPQYAYTEEDRLEKQFDGISGISEVSKGQLPSASIPAIGMQLLQEQDETRIGIETTWMEDSFARTGRQLLLFAKNHYKTQRKRKLAGKNGEYIITPFTGEDIGESTDVNCIKGSTNPTSKVLRRQELATLYREGTLGDPMDPKVRENYLAQLEYGDIGEVWIDQSLDMQQIKKTILQIEEGQQPLVSEFDNHELHLQEKNRYRKSDKFEMLDPQRQELFMMDMETHLQYIVELTTPPQAIETPDPNEAVAMDAAAHEAQENDRMNMASMNLEGAPIEQMAEG